MFKINEKYYTPNFSKGDLVSERIYMNSYNDSLLIKRHMAFKTKEEAFDIARNIVITMKNMANFEKTFGKIERGK